MATSQLSPLGRLALLSLLIAHVNAQGGSHFLLHLRTSAVFFLLNAVIRYSQATHTFICGRMVN